MTLRGALFLGLGLLASGCTCLQEPYVEADRLTFEAIAPAYAAYVEEDDDLDEEQKERRRRTLRAWAARIQEARRALDQP